MPPVVIENPILNSPFEEPAKHFRFDEENNITADVVEGRRSSSYFMPIAAPKKKGKQTLFDNEFADEKKEETEHVNKIRERVKGWRKGGWPETTPITLALLRHWTDTQRERRLFFCQIEALETMIFVIEVARMHRNKSGWS